MSEEQPKLTKIKERFKLIKIDDYVFQIHDIDNDVYLVAEQICNLLNKQQVTIDQLNLAIDDLLSHTSCDEIKKENERLKNKLNVTALELVDEAISMGKAVEISEMNYHEFLEYRKKKGKAMELQR